MSGGDLASAELLPRERWGQDLPGLWPMSRSTYNCYPYGPLPAVPPGLPAGWDWLLSLDTDPEHSIGAGNTRTIITELAGRGATLPADVVAFYAHPAAAERVVSSTACWTTFGVLEAPDGAPLVLFLRDQQDCAYWLLHLDWP